ncbi:hypothetical protein QMU90_001864 [Edwardsiella ictaluri]|uniref:Uncharacterized protein n=2 Tax=Edwardsiella ictaluri TaxID=67780 RepID=A0ABY8GJG4_EDWIC|nr:hypothetical protein [Edwardsiella ictaluri]ELV7528029.1 hypothetical protein [Edwardsiella ictaluri]KMQ78981.1 hypothetical protein ABY58_05655 [Edwardsiella ictaluri]KOO55451.1 hypothetical protein ACS33_06985 [Edwardsiella ictaluri]WFN97485.1 hypothetical protein MAY91_05430 [Edwardsiella ictaluri]
MSELLLSLQGRLYTLSPRALHQWLWGGVFLLLMSLLAGLWLRHTLEQQRLRIQLTEGTAQAAMLQVQRWATELRLWQADVVAIAQAARQARCAPVHNVALSWQIQSDGRRHISADMTFSALLQTLDTLSDCGQRVSTLTITPLAQGVHITWVGQEGE